MRLSAAKGLQGSVVTATRAEAILGKRGAEGREGREGDDGGNLIKADVCVSCLAGGKKKIQTTSEQRPRPSGEI